LPLPREASTTTYTRSMSCPPKLDDAEDAGGVTSSLGLEMVEAVAAMERSATYHPMRPPLPPLMNERRQE
jgi:hypothetical protein